MAQRVFNHYSTVRREMVEDTTRFLDWALAHSEGFPRIPRFRVDSGKTFTQEIRVAFWSNALLKMQQMSDRQEK